MMTHNTERPSWASSVNKILFIISFLISVVPSLAYFSVTTILQKASMRAEVEINSFLISQLINQNPDYWKYEGIRFYSILKHRLHDDFAKESRQLVDNALNVIAEDNEPLQPPFLKVREDVFDSGIPVGYLEISRSLRLTLFYTFLLLFLSIVAGISFFYMMSVFPLKTLKLAFATLDAERKQATITLNSIEDAVITTDVSHRILSLNVSAQQKIGISPDLATGCFLSEKITLLDDKTREPYTIPPNACFESETGKTLHRNAVLVRPTDRKEFQVELTVTPLHDDKGQLLGLVIAVHDISESKRLEANLKEKILENEVIIRHAGIGIGFVKNDIFQDVNTIAAEIIGLPPEKIIGHHASVILFENLRYTQPITHVYEALGNGKILELEYQLAQTDGKTKWIRLLGQAVDPTNLHEKGSVWIAQDTTQLKEYQRNLKTAKTLAEEANSFKSAFLAHISHEIRSPMSGIIGMNRLVLGTELTEQQREFLTILDTSAEMLLQLLNNLLDISKIEAGLMELEEKPFSLFSVFTYVYNIKKLQAEEKNISLSFEIAEDVPVLLLGDELRLGQIIINLVGNAIKFTYKGSVTVHCEKNSESDSEIVLKFRVTDTGIGIPKSVQEKIFEPYAQASTSVTRTHGGTGLGLSICKEITQLFGGDIWIESETGKGASFFFTGRFKKDTDSSTAGSIQKIQKIDSSSFSQDGLPLRILLVEDVLFNQNLAKIILEKANHSVQVAMDGHEALVFLASSDFDVILMDVKMPVMDGLTATRLIRRCETCDNPHAREDNILIKSLSEKLKGRHTPIIAMTANAAVSDQEEVMASGMDGYICKPFNEREMMDIIDEVVFTKLPIRVFRKSTV